MADLDVQPKKRSPWWLWLLLALVALAVIFFLFRSCDRHEDTTAGTAATQTENTGSPTGADGVAATSTTWDSLNFDVPPASYEEITDQDIEVRGNDEYAIYSLDETILFPSDQSTIQPQAAQKLQQVATSLGKRYNGGQIRIYGHTDAQGSATYNKELAEQRAQAVQNWLVQNGNITEGNISLHPVGESRPVASNATAEGRQQNRRVEIVARRPE